MKNKKTIIIGSVIVLAIAATAYILLSKSDSTQIKVETTLAKTGDVTTMVTATGTVEPINQVEVGTQVSGEVEKVYVDFNSEVKQGQQIAELDKTNLKAAVLQAQATYDNALNERNYLQTIFDRQDKLFQNKLISQADYDEALYNLKTAKNTVVQRLSDLQKAKTNLNYADIFSPISGVVLSRDVDEGQTVAASYSTPTLFTIAQDLKEMQVEADVDEADIGQVEEGQRVTFTVDAYPNEEFTGTVTQVRLNPTITSNVVTYTVVIKANNEELKLKPGLTATISIYTLELKNILTIESKAINYKPDMELIMAYNGQDGQGPPPPPSEGDAKRKTVDGTSFPQEGSAPSENDSSNANTLWRVREGRIQPVKVELGASDGVNVQVLNGLTKGDSLVYNIKTISAQEASSSSSDNESPFMPKPPGRRNKK